jgi:prepilin-type N-terminal cleavage/methylation domain-containing protein
MMKRFSATACKPPANTARQGAGFSLVEMAIVLVIVGLMLGGLLMPLSMQMEQRRIGETQKAMDDIREALTGFALRNGYLPCPAISNSNGLEDRTGSGCTDGRRVGYVPWATLGVSKLDSWNHLFRYSVTPAFTDSNAFFSLTTARDITVFTRGVNGELLESTAPNDVPALVMSFGKNGFRATSDQGIVQADNVSGNQDERDNAGGEGTRFISRPASDADTSAGGQFDDIVSWISPNILYNRMVLAQKLP